MVSLIFDDIAVPKKQIVTEIESFLSHVSSLETQVGNSVILHQDGVEKSYYIRVTLKGDEAATLLDLDARLIPESADSYRANRELQLRHQSFATMSRDASNGREFNDIIVEFYDGYSPEKPLKVWGGQHRSKAIQTAAVDGISKYHGFRVYFGLSKQQRTALALISNTNINISNDLFDRQIEETFIGTHLRKWCEGTGLLNVKEDFPDVGARSERITTHLARTFFVNYFDGIDMSLKLKPEELDKNFYEPYLCKSGVLDERYEATIQKIDDIWNHPGLKAGGIAFAALDKAQSAAVNKSKNSRKSFRTKALTASVLCSWAFVAGLLNSDQERLSRHLEIPKAPKRSVDPLNAVEMSQFKHNLDPPTYRGLGTRSAPKDRQRMAQVFLARTAIPDQPLNKQLLLKAVSQVVALKIMREGYA